MTSGTGGSGGADLRVLVVGAGIAGLSTARALRCRGLVADVVERQPTLTHTGAGIFLPGNAARALRALGLESAVAERASLIAHQRLCDHRGRLLADIDMAGLWGDVGPCLALHRADLHEVLASHGDPVPTWMGRAVVRISEQDNTATVEFSDGTTGPLRPGHRRRRHPLHGPPSRDRGMRGPPGGPASLALRHRVPAGADHLDGATGPRGHLPSRADRPRPGLLLHRHAHRGRHPASGRAGDRAACRAPGRLRRTRAGHPRHPRPR